MQQQQHITCDGHGRELIIFKTDIRMYFCVHFHTHTCRTHPHLTHARAVQSLAAPQSSRNTRPAFEAFHSMHIRRIAYGATINCARCLPKYLCIQIRDDLFECPCAFCECARARALTQASARRSKRNNTNLFVNKLCFMVVSN